jgi:multidrug efflux pump subunit AcrB
VDETIANANELRMELESSFLPQLKNRYMGLRYNIEGEGKEQKESMADVKNGFIIALFAIYALLAIPFRSFTQPFIVMAAIPFGIIGAVFGHLIMGYNLSLMSMFGIVGLAGVVVNDSLVLIDATNRIRGQAIILTSLTTFAGLTPMLLERSLQAQFLIPMAISLGFGVLFGTGITLLLVPSLYMILDDIHDLWDNVKARIVPS